MDMTNKLILSPMLWFFPKDYELAFGMAIVIIYTTCVLMMKPYLREEVDLLQLLANTELYLYLLVGWVFRSQIVLDTASDIMLSIIMVSITCLFVKPSSL